MYKCILNFTSFDTCITNYVDLSIFEKFSLLRTKYSLKKKCILNFASFDNRIANYVNLSIFEEKTMFCET